MFCVFDESKCLSFLTLRHLGFDVGERGVKEAHTHVCLPMLGARLRKIVHGILGEKQQMVIIKRRVIEE